MKVALFYPRNLLASWYSLGGYYETLTRMGHEVLDCPLAGNQVHDIEKFVASLPSIEQLNECDCVLSAFHEYTVPWYQAIYGLDAWKKLRVPVIARFDESMDRADLNLPQRLDELKEWANFYSFPAAQDAKKYGGQWVPFGVDHTMFEPKPTEKKYDFAFIGSLYPLRTNYLNSLSPFLPGVDFHHGHVVVQDLGGVRARESTELLAENYRQIKVFFCLPPLSRLLVCKVFEVMGCGTFVMYPRLPGGSWRNNELFENKKHIVYYDPGYLKDNARDIMHYLEADDEREAIAKAGCELVRSKFRLEQMLEKVLEPAVKAKEATNVVECNSNG